jgi:hypothetical protein
VMKFCMAFRADGHEITRKFVKHSQIIEVMYLCYGMLFAPLTKSLWHGGKLLCDVHAKMHCRDTIDRQTVDCTL